MSKLNIIGRNIAPVGNSYIDIDEFETNVSPSDKEDQIYLLHTTNSGTFKLGNATEYNFVEESNTYVTKVVKKS